MIASQPAAAEDQDRWEHDYQQRLFEWAASNVKDEFQPATWQAFWLTAVNDTAPQEAARQLGMSVGAVYIAKSRVLKRLRERIREIEEM